MVLLYGGKTEQSLRLREVNCLFICFPLAYEKNSCCGFRHQKIELYFHEAPCKSHSHILLKSCHPDEINEALNA